LGNLDFLIVNVREHLTGIAHVKPLSAAGACREMVGVGLSDAIGR
jgi:hypothetical protein